MSLRRFGILVVAVVASLAVGVAPAFGTQSSDENGRIAFESDRRTGEDLDIWSMRPDGSDPVNLTADSVADDFGPSWRPDGRKIAFMSNRVTATNPEGEFEIFVMNADGSGLRQLTANRLDDEIPSWSPDGRMLVFQRDFDPVVGEVDYDILTMRADGTRQRNLTRSPGVQDFDADWSPDGRRIAFVSERDGDAEIYTMRPDGSRVHQLTFNDGPFDGGPAWSPDGRRIAFDSDRDTPDVGEIYTMRADGSDQTRLTFNEVSDFLSAWSPDGRKLAFTTDRDGDFEIYTMRTDGSRQVNRTRNPAFDIDPDWQSLPEHHH
jgi:Tol biopolymer transport system component